MAWSHCGCRCWAWKLENALEKKIRKKIKEKLLCWCYMLFFTHFPPFPIMFSYYATLLIFPDEMGSSSNKCIRQVSHEWPWQQKLHRGQVPV